MRTTIIYVSIMIAPAFVAFSAQAQVAVGGEHCVVNVRTDDALNMRSAGYAESIIISKLRYGQCGVMVIDECKGQWCPVEDGYHRGWVHRRYISMVSPARYCVNGIAPPESLSVRAYPSGGSQVVTELRHNQCEIQFLPYSTKDWQKIRASGYEGWTPAGNLSGQ
jgi:SH3-like domain-containing protein